MACGSGYYDDDPVREQRRDQAAAKKNEAAAKKIVEFFVSKVGETNVTLGKGTQTPATRLILTVRDCLCVEHRGYAILVTSTEIAYDTLAAEFKLWRASHMAHARIAK